MFHQDEGHGQDRGWRSFRRYHGEDEGRGPGFGPGSWGPGDSGHGHGHGPGHGPGRGWIPRDFGFGPGRGPQVRRGDVRTAMLALLAEEPMHGYQIIQRLGERSGGMWRPSAGSVYPTLQQLEDEGLVKGDERDGRKVYTLTDDGQKAAKESAGGRAPWEMPGSEETTSLYGQFRPLAAAVAQVSQVGSPETLAKAQAILVEARRSLYRLLAEDSDQDSTTTAAQE